MRKAIRLGIILMLLCGISSAQEGITILHLNDFESRLLPVGPHGDRLAGGERAAGLPGGAARLATALQSARDQSAYPVLTVTAGDNVMGTLFHTIAREHGGEYRILADMGVDVMTLGNHDFDFFPDGLASMLRAAAKSVTLPEIVLSNVEFSATDGGDDAFEALYADGIVKKYTIIERGGLRIGFFGLMGRDAAEVAPFAKPIRFIEPELVAREMVHQLRVIDGADVVICLSHSGVEMSKGGSWQGEEVNLANKTPGIDLLVGGHTHTLLREPIITKGAPIVQAGEHGNHFGVATLERDSSYVSLTDYRIVEVDATSSEDAEIAESINQLQALVENEFLQPAGLQFSQRISESEFTLEETNAASALGDLSADAMRWAGNQHGGTDIGIVANGNVREDLAPDQDGMLYSPDVFGVLPMGVGFAEPSPGYPLLRIYLTAAEIKRSLEVITSIYPIKGSAYYVHTSGARFRYNRNRVIFDRVIDVDVMDANGDYQPVDFSDTDRLYSITLDYYVASFINVIGDFTAGFLTIKPKDANGNEVEDLKTLLFDANPAKPGVQEVKAWQALFQYLQQLPDADGNGLPEIPTAYRDWQPRVQVLASWSPGLMLKNARPMTYIAFAILALAAALALYGLYWLVRKVME